MIPFVRQSFVFLLKDIPSYEKFRPYSKISFVQKKRHPSLGIICMCTVELARPKLVMMAARFLKPDFTVKFDRFLPDVDKC